MRRGKRLARRRSLEVVLGEVVAVMMMVVGREILLHQLWWAVQGSVAGLRECQRSKNNEPYRWGTCYQSQQKKTFTTI